MILFPALVSKFTLTYLSWWKRKLSWWRYSILFCFMIMSKDCSNLFNTTVDCPHLSQIEGIFKRNTFIREIQWSPCLAISYNQKVILTYINAWLFGVIDNGRHVLILRGTGTQQGAVGCYCIFSTDV